MNCRACHLVDELQDEPSGGVRTYCDFARQSPVPQRADGFLTSPRNSPRLVNATLSHDIPTICHFDGEFPTSKTLPSPLLTGRNFGWLPTEAAPATAHIANVIRNDAGKKDLAEPFGGGIPFAILLLGTDAAIPAHLRIPLQYRLYVATASDAQVLQAVVALMQAYMDSLRYSTDDSGRLRRLSLRRFLEKNGLPRSPNQSKTGLACSQRLLMPINQLNSPVFVDVLGYFMKQFEGTEILTFSLY